MGVLRIFLFLLCVLLPIKAAETNSVYMTTYDELYADGLEAYWNENWEGCIEKMNKALENYKFIQREVQVCSLSCRPTHASEQGSLEVIRQHALCTHKCEEKKFGNPESILRISDEVKHTFKSMEPYRYLQYAYFKVGDLANSVAACYTYASYDPLDPMMKDNLDWFRKHENATEEMFVNLEPISHIDQYDNGIQAYNREDYTEAIPLLEDSLVKYYEIERKCRVDCEGEYNAGDEYKDEPTAFHRQITNHYQAVLECYMACPDEAARVNANSFINNFVPKVYHYLQFAYYHVGKHWQAAQAAKSYLLLFPENVLIKNNLNHFENSTDAKPKEDVSLFHRRLKVQSKILRHIYQNFGIRNFSESLLNPYMEEDDGDSEENNNESSENVVDSTENNADLAENEDSIVGEMGDISKNTEDTEDNGDSAENIELKENSDKSTKNVAATLKQVEPPKESKTQAKVEYNSMKDKTEDMIEAKDAYNARMEVIRKKREAESDVDISHMSSDIGHEVIDSNSIISIIDSTSLSQPPTPEGPLLHSKVVLLSNSTQMAGPLRFAVDGFASEQQCQDLIDLELSGGVLGDGYMGRVSPHSEHELFQGMTVYLAAKLAEKGKVPPQTAALYYKLSEEARLQVKMYFKLTQELYFDYTHLVCRTTVKGKPVERTDLSHPVHSDNCLLKENGSCLKERPAYTWRDYSAILYLNDEFEGGEFIMTDATARRVKVQVRPKCGRLVSFSAGKECLHGVKPVTKGRRCAMALWFTMDPTHNEESRQKAEKILKRLLKDEL